MTKLLLFALSILILWSCSSNSIPNWVSPKYLGLKGDIESIKDTEYDVIEKFGEITPNTKDINYVSTYKFDNTGNLINEGMFYGSGTVICSITIKYKDDKPIQQTIKNSEFSYQSLEDKYNTEIWDFTPIKDNEYTLINKEKGVTTKVKINSSKLSIEITDSDINGNTTSESSRSYDKKGNILENLQKDTGGKTLGFRSTYENNLEVEKVELPSNKKYTYQYPKFDEKGNWVEKIMFQNEGPQSITIREIKYRK